MSLLNIAVFTLFALAVTLLARFTNRQGWRNPLLLAASVLAIFWLQPALAVRNLDFWLPLATLAIALLGWAVTLKSADFEPKRDLSSLLTVIGLVSAVALTRYLTLTGILTPSRPPQTLTVLIVLSAITGLFALLSLRRRTALWLSGAGILFLLIFFIILKFPPLTLLAARFLRALSAQPPELASAFDLRWLGFSYVAFRLIHTLRDRQSGRLPAVSLQEYLIYIIFFPAFGAGPIDRIQRFLTDLRAPFNPTAAQFGQAGKRLFIGLFKKFAVADTLALIALSAASAGQVSSAGWMWILLYAYTFQIYLDFSGYTDIAIGLGGLIGIHLPENFNRPYLRPNLTQFWNNWHITLTQWFRAYFFNPFTRWLRSGGRSLPVWSVILITQLATMILIGLWHGITLNFILWGAWHGLGLFLQNRWTEFVKPRALRLEQKPRLSGTLTVLSTLFTFHFVVLGWVWFALPTPQSSLRVLAVLFGGGS